MKRSTFYHCEKCGTITMKVADGGGELSCCGEPMTILEPNSSGAAPAKHVPVIERAGDAVTVTVGEVEHPMEDAHSIQWVYVITEEGALSQCLKPGQAPVAKFDLAGQTPIEAYEYCNLHGLWKASF